MITLHVEPQNGRWIVRRDGAPAPLSEHPDAGTALCAARAQGAVRVVVRDRYHRTHEESARRPLAHV